MYRLVILINFPAIATTTIISVFSVLGLPALSQEVQTDSQSGSVESVESMPVATEETAGAESITAITANDPEIPADQLEVLLKPLSRKKLEVEAEAWFLLLQAKAQEISDLEYSIKVKGEEIVGTADTDKEKQVITVTQLKTEQTSLVSRFTIVLDALDAKGGDTEEYRQYISAISGLEFNITDTEGIGLRFKTWLQSEEGGIAFGINLLKFSSILIVTVIISPRLGDLVNHALERITTMSNLFRDFTVMTVKRSILVIGALLALASVGVNLGPILAVLGGASFVLAFALQSNLGNFASGLMLLINKPFDMGDEVKISGLWGMVHSINLASTKIRGFNHQIYTIPNNTVWGGIIENLTTQDIRRASFDLKIRHDTSISRVREVLLDIGTSHPLVLESPPPAANPWTYYDYYVLVQLKVWVKTSNYWKVWNEIIVQIQDRFKDEDITLALPHQNINIQQLPEEYSVEERIEKSENSI